MAPSSVKAQGGSRTEMFTATNTTGAACVVAGYPGVAPYRSQPGGGGGSSVHALVEPIPAHAGALGGPAQTLTLPPGKAAVFFLTWSVAGGSCQDADGITFSPPLSSTLAPVSFPFRFCGTAIKQSVMLPTGTSA